jgi:squalene-hopene/tetraprenyl-beta-curcumene cyclase
MLTTLFLGLVPAFSLSSLSSPSATLKALTALPTCGPLVSVSQEAERAAPRRSSEDAKDLCDNAIRWLRSQQREDGSYGDVGETALVLAALALSPRAYTASEGPFVTRALDALAARQRDDGAICAADADPLAALEQTIAAARALALYDGATAGAALQKAEAFLRVPTTTPMALGKLEAEAALLLVERTEAEITPDGRIDGPGGAVRATAERVLALAAAAKAIKKIEVAAPSTATALPKYTPADRAAADVALVRGSAFLVATTEGDSGLWGAGGRPDPGITALVTSALMAVPKDQRSAEHEAAITRGLAHLRSLQHEDGSIHVGGALTNYVTSASVLALTETGDPADAERVRRATEFLRVLQADEGEGYGPDHKYYGGIGYGGDERPDLSNVWLAASALEAAGISDDDEALAKMVAFLERTQNRTESNDLVLVEGGVTIRPGNDGGAGYAPGQSKAGTVTLPDGSVSPRSYGSMTYALLGCYLFAGVDKSDPRVVAAFEWIRANYTLDLNPGFEASGDPAAPYQGLFYYFNAMAKALHAYGEETIVDADGIAHDWRSELAGRLVSLQRPDGSWLNENSPRWWEGNPVLATAYAMITLDDALPRAATAEAGAPVR